MGIRAKKKIAEHIFKENIYNNNLISDISNTNYIKNNNGKTHLKPIEGHGVFVDDMFLFGYLRKEDIVFNKGGINCTTGKNGAATFIIEQNRSIINYTIGKDNPFPIHVNFTDTILLENGFSKKGRILSTIELIEKRVNVREKWKECNNLEDPFGVYILKVDVSNISLSTLQKNLRLLQNKLISNGASIYSLDYTRDYSGTLKKTRINRLSYNKRIFYRRRFRFLFFRCRLYNFK